MSNNNIQIAYDQILKFNAIGGVLNSANHEATLNNVELYISLMKEENKETYDAFTECDAVELLDGACDQFVVACGLLQVLREAGFNVEKALARVCANNLTKMPTEFDHNKESTAPEGSKTYFTPYGHVVYKRESDGKIQKPVDYVPVDLVSCVPDNFFQGE